MTGSGWDAHGVCGRARSSASRACSGCSAVLAATIGLGRRGWLPGAAAVPAWPRCSPGRWPAPAGRARPGEPGDAGRAMLACGVTALMAARSAARRRRSWWCSRGGAGAGRRRRPGGPAHRHRLRLGARFDMEVDAFLILVLSVCVAAQFGWWVLAHRACPLRCSWPRAGVLPWLRRSAAPPWAQGRRRGSGVVLTVAAAGVLPEAVTAAMLARGTGAAGRILRAQDLGCGAGPVGGPPPGAAWPR